MFFKRKESENTRIINLVEELKDGFCTIKLSGEFIYINPAASEMFELANLNGDHNFYKDIIRDEKHIDHIRKVVQTQDYIKDYELELYTLQNHKFPVLLTFNLIKDPRKNIIGISLLIKDMTYIKKVQQQLLQAQKMESIGMLASGIAHEFNNILTGIIPNAELIKMTTEQSDMNFNRAQSIQKSALRAADIVKKLLSFARNDKPETSEPTNFCQVIHETFDIIRKLFDRNIEIVTLLPPDLLFVTVDATRLQQIIMNLAINAKDAIKGTGKISFSAENFIVTAKSKSHTDLNEGKYICFQISDTGHGIEKNKISRIFDPFFTTKDPGKGTGLGLSIVYGIITSLSGKIEVQSTPNVGTTFTVYLPATAPQKLKDFEEYKILQATAGFNILVIDDEQMIREMAKDMLTSLGHKVMLANNGTEGMQIYRDNMKDIDLILLDLIMPQMNGATCFENLKALNPNVKVIITSGIGQLHQKKELERIGIDAYLEKPFSLKNMAVKIESIMAKPAKRKSAIS